MIKRPEKTGAALLLFLILFTVASTSLLIAITQSIYSDVVAYNTLQHSKQSFLLADTFTEEQMYRYISGQIPNNITTISLFDAEATSTITFNGVDVQFRFETDAESSDHHRSSRGVLQVGSGASFNFGVQTGNGGFSMSNTATINGNLFSNGSILGQGNSIVRGDVISAGPSGLIDGIHATGSAWANTIGDNGTPNTALIEGDAHYQTIDLSDVTVNGTLYSGWPDEPQTDMPIPDDVVDAHKASTTAAIAAGDGTLIASTSPECATTGEYEVDTSTSFTGPTKIECDFRLDKSSTVLTLEDTLWVEGSISFTSGPTVEADPATSTDSILIIADNEANRSTDSQVVVGQGTTFVAASSPKSYIVLLSMNDDYENGGSETAIDMGQSSSGDVLIYAGSGLVELGNKIDLKEVTGYRIVMGNNTTIDYESGLLNLNFSSGPGGGFEVYSWNETE